MPNKKPKEFVVEGYILQGNSILLMHHRKLNMWLPPGGHIEKDETPEEALIREIKEETGLDAEILKKQRVTKDFDVDILHHPNHIQLENIGDDHQHIDLIYVCRLKGGKLVKNQESKKIKWFSLEELKKREDVPEEVRFFGEMFVQKEANKINNTNPVLAEIISEIDKHEIENFKQYSLLVVQHLQKNTINFIKLLKQAGFKEIILVAKPYSINNKALEEINKHSKVRLLKNQGSNLRQLVKEEIDALIKKKQKFLAIDLGGDISEALNEYPDKEISSYCLGVVEDTKNGLYWLEKKEERLKFPLVSVASSFLKDTIEAHFVGSSVSRNTENLFTNILSTELTGKRVLVVGYGSIGRSIAQHFKNKNCLVDVFDCNPKQKVKAIIEGFNAIPDKNYLGHYNLIIGATGRENVIDEKDLMALKNEAILINASTKKREFDHLAIKKLSKKIENIENFGSKIALYNGREIYLAANGTPINFFNNESVPGSILDLIFSELFLSLKILSKEKLTPKLYKIEANWPEIEEKVAGHWYNFWHKHKSYL